MALARVIMSIGVDCLLLQRIDSSKKKKKMLDSTCSNNQQARPHTWVAAAPKELIRDFILVPSSAADWRIALLPMSSGTYSLRFNPAWQLDPRIKELNWQLNFGGGPG